MPQIVGCYPNELKQRVGGVIHPSPRSYRLSHRILGLGSRPSSSVFHCCFHPMSRSHSPPFCSFANSGVITIGALFVVVHTMGRTHVISNICHKVPTCFVFPLFFLLCFLTVLCPHPSFVALPFLQFSLSYACLHSGIWQ